MKRRVLLKRYVFALTAALMTFTLTACGGKEPDLVVDTLVEGNVAAASGQGQAASAPEEDLLDVGKMFTDRDLSGNYDENESIIITLTGDSASCDDKPVFISGNTVTVTEAGTYILSGTLNGMVVVEAGNSDKVQLVLKDVEIDNENNAAIYVKTADKVFITLAEGTQNSLHSGSFTAIDDNNIDGAIFAKCDLTVNGSGSLDIEAAEGHGVVSKDDLVVTGGMITVNAEGHGLEGKDSVRVAGGRLKITSGKDGIHSENSDKEKKGYVYVADGQFVIISNGDGISASYYLQVDGGSFSILTADGSSNRTVSRDEDGDTVSTKGLKSDAAMIINGGNFVVDSQDDALHAGGNLTVNGGELQLATGDDGIHSDETATVAGGRINITDSYEGIEGNDVVISGGEIHLVSTDDGLNAAGGKDQSGFGGWIMGGGDRFGATDSTITISGGLIYINAAGDGIDSNGDLIVTGGETYVSGPENGANGALDYNGSGQVTGGILVAVGSSQMAINFGDTSTQGSILTNVVNCKAGDEVQLLDAQGNILVSYTAESSFNSVVVSCPQLKQGETYTLTAGGVDTEITMESLIYGNGMGGFGGPGEMGGPGDMGGGFGNPGGGRGSGGGRGGDRKPDGDFDGEMPGPPDGDFNGPPGPRGNI